MGGRCRSTRLRQNTIILSHPKRTVVDHPLIDWNGPDSDWNACSERILPKTCTFGACGLTAFRIARPVHASRHDSPRYRMRCPRSSTLLRARVHRPFQLTRLACARSRSPPSVPPVRLAATVTAATRVTVSPYPPSSYHDSCVSHLPVASSYRLLPLFLIGRSWTDCTSTATWLLCDHYATLTIPFLILPPTPLPVLLCVRL